MKSSEEQNPKKIENENKRKQLRKRRQTANKKVKEVFYSHFLGCSFDIYLDKKSLSNKTEKSES